MSWCLGETSFDSHENNIPKEKSSGGWMRNRVDGGGSEKYDYNKRHYEQNLSVVWIIYGDIGGVDTYILSHFSALCILVRKIYSPAFHDSSEEA